jgi:PPP family 3-phenylpropionic acid transporter
VGVVAEVALMRGFGWIFPRFRPPVLLAFALASAAIRWTLIASITSVSVLILLQPLHALSFALVWLASLAYVKTSAPPAALATAQGLFSAALAAGSVLGMPLWGALYHRYGGAFTFHVATVLSAAAASLALFWARRTSGAESPGSVAAGLAGRAP